MKREFEIGECYSRDYIHQKLRGSKLEYLPHVNGVVVCGCFRKDLNPDEVLPGDGAGIVKWADVFSRQNQAVPVFLKEASNRWRYKGKWRVDKVTRDRIEIEARNKRTGRKDISMILRLVKE